MRRKRLAQRVRGEHPLKGAGWLALGVVKFVIGGIFLVGMLLLGLFALPFALIFG